jgi:hypothetical protein
VVVFFLSNLKNFGARHSVDQVLALARNSCNQFSVYFKEIFAKYLFQAKNSCCEKIILYRNTTLAADRL